MNLKYKYKTVLNIFILNTNVIMLFKIFCENLFMKAARKVFSKIFWILRKKVKIQNIKYLPKNYI